MSIRLRLILWQTILVALVLAAFAGVVYVGIMRQEASKLDATLRLRAESVRQTVVAT